MELIGLGFLLMAYLLFDTGATAVKKWKRQRKADNAMDIRHDTFSTGF